MCFLIILFYQGILGPDFALLFLPYFFLISSAMSIGILNEISVENEHIWRKMGIAEDVSQYEIPLSDIESIVVISFVAKPHYEGSEWRFCRGWNYARKKETKYAPELSNKTKAYFFYYFFLCDFVHRSTYIQNYISLFCWRSFYWSFKSVRISWPGSDSAFSTFPISSNPFWNTVAIFQVVSMQIS